MLEIAEREQLTGIAIAGVNLQGYSHTAYEGGENFVHLIGAVEYVKHRILEHLAE